MLKTIDAWSKATGADGIPAKFLRLLLVLVQGCLYRWWTSLLNPGCFQTGFKLQESHQFSKAGQHWQRKLQANFRSSYSVKNPWAVCKWTATIICQRKRPCTSQKNNLDIRRTLQPLPQYLKRSTNANGQRIKGWSLMSLISHYYSKNSKQTESLVLSMRGFLATLPTESSLFNVTGLTQMRELSPMESPKDPY